MQRRGAGNRDIVCKFDADIAVDLVVSMGQNYVCCCRTCIKGQSAVDHQTRCSASLLRYRALSLDLRVAARGDSA